MTDEPTPVPGGTADAAQDHEPAQTVLVVGDLAITREGLAALLDRVPGFRVLRPTCPVSDLIDRMRTDHPRFVLLSLVPGGRASTQLGHVVHAVRASPDDAHLAVLSPNGDGLVRTLLDPGPGADAYLIDGIDADPASLVRALQDAAAGVVSMDAGVVDALVRRHNNSGLQDLTRREYDVLAELARGLSNQGIATRLHITTKAVEAHVSHIFRKLDLPPDSSRDRRLSAAMIFQRERY